jgi:hypothetical protein
LPDYSVILRMEIILAEGGQCFNGHPSTLLFPLQCPCIETGKADAYHIPATERPYESSSINGSGRPLNLIQVRKPVNPVARPPHIFNRLANGENLCPSLMCVDHVHISLIDFGSTPGINSKHNRFWCHYATLIDMAILRAKNRCLPPTQIYQWISDHF